ncbi:MAG: cytochrome c3 family protein [Deltaproteobacteria bacterium]|nr:cytochrome c3 family protein [Deltaproteobacteria bacterium]
MQITRSRKPHLPLPTTILIVVGVLVWVFMASDAIAWYPATYAESAHGDPISGVNRSDTPEDDRYDIGSCAHCHDTFDDSICGVNPLMLFEVDNPTSQTDNFCFQCHDSNSTVQAVTNYSYSSTFGGGTANSTNIGAAFRFGAPTQTSEDGSSHNLQKVRFWAGTRSLGAWITADTNGCLVCHDVHNAQKNHPVVAHPGGGVKTAIRRTMDAQDAPGNQWGDEVGTDVAGVELMNEYTANYQAPFWKNSSSTYEPGGNGTANGSNLPNFVDFCDRCHNKEIPGQRTDAYGRENIGLRIIEWGVNDADRHGNVAGSPKMGNSGCGYLGSLKPPYNDPDKNYVLSCTDCHEPHGSPNPWLLRTCVNGKDGIIFSDPYDGISWYEFCTACHEIMPGGAYLGHQACGPHAWDPDGPSSGNFCYGCHVHGVSPPSTGGL